jgi:S-DNA-T family DNA segregation ATPase FtsK/SpoIIIE
MTSNLYSDRQRAALRDLTRFAAERARAEKEANDKLASQTQTAERVLLDVQGKIQAQFTAALHSAQMECQKAAQAAAQRFKQEHGSLGMEYVNSKQQTEELAAQESEQAKTEFEEAQWTLTTVYESAVKVAKDSLVATQKIVGTAMQKLEAAQAAAHQVLARWNLAPQSEADAPAASPPPADLLRAIHQCAATAHEQLALLNEVSPPAKLKSWVMLLAGVAGLVLLVPVFIPGGPGLYWLIAVTLLVPLAAFGVWQGLTRKTRATMTALYLPLRQAAIDAAAYQPVCLSQAIAIQAQQLTAAKQQRNEADLGVQRNHNSKMQAIAQYRERELRAAEETYPPKLEELIRRRDQDLQQVEAKRRQAVDHCTTRRDSQLELAAQKRDRGVEAAQRLHDEEWQQLTAAWKIGLNAFLDVIKTIEEDCSRLFPAWIRARQERSAITVVPAGIRFGEVHVGPECIPHGVPSDPRLRELRLKDQWLSALLGFPQRGSLFLKASGSGRAVAVQTLQAVMLRCLTAIPPGQVRFTILDPVGLGENFAAFGHLADFVESLVTGRIWTEATHIEQRLADVTAHIENVNQHFLRNQFQSLAEYNEQAGEIAEPYRILVIANFPVNFSADAARRLLSIAANGARCGVHTLISVDMSQPLPQGFPLADLERAATTLVWKDDKFVWNDSDYSRFPLRLETPPPDQIATALLRVVGEEARTASRVEVPFSLLAPPPAERWTGDSRSSIRVPLGRAAALKNHYLHLGPGTSQHVLIAGKTGSGKSTLLHALITQLALFYSPDEVELYLVDFKKGVEFKTYAVHELPHARVIAVESEREFGLSVLQRLDAELKLRGEQFRALGVNDLSSYRQAAQKPLPRVLLIVDEFQEFFVEDDKLAQEAALLLDRLVRQGRAFGVHILLGSQTLGGAYSLARSTIDQMAVRIALQCSETDGHLILSKENGAARLLARPGEAIYNDANGRVEGNHLMQTVWLSDAQHEEALVAVRELAQERNYVPAQPQIIFEGTAPAELAKNPLLSRLLDNPAWPGAPGEWVAWLGEAIAIKDPTAVVFRRQSGSNLLLIGQHEEAAANLLTSILLSLAAHRPLVETEADQAMRFHVLGGLAAGSDKLLEGLPTPVHWCAAQQMPATLGDLAQEVDRRHKTPALTAPPQFLFINGLQRFRDLRKQEDEFGFSRRGDDKVANPAKLFATIIREGPAVGVFTVVWCDTLANLQRVLERQALREFEMRVLFQMSAADSSNLIDSPLASRLGPYRAFYYTEDQGRLEKFRPYGAVPEEWVEVFRRSLACVK